MSEEMGQVNQDHILKRFACLGEEFEMQALHKVNFKDLLRGEVVWASFDIYTYNQGEVSRLSSPGNRNELT